MVSPVNNGVTQQVIANQFQQQNNRQVEDPQQREQGRTQASGTTQESGKINGDSDTKQNIVQTASAAQTETQSTSGRDQGRGSLLDISV